MFAIQYHRQRNGHMMPILPGQYMPVMRIADVFKDIFRSFKLLFRSLTMLGFAIPAFILMHFIRPLKNTMMIPGMVKLWRRSLMQRNIFWNT